jgi:hypothetical protein
MANMNISERAVAMLVSRTPVDEGRSDRLQIGENKQDWFFAAGAKLLPDCLFQITVDLSDTTKNLQRQLQGDWSTMVVFLIPKQDPPVSYFIDRSNATWITTWTAFIGVGERDGQSGKRVPKIHLQAFLKNINLNMARVLDQEHLVATNQVRAINQNPESEGTGVLPGDYSIVARLVKSNAILEVGPDDHTCLPFPVTIFNVPDDAVTDL